MSTFINKDSTSSNVARSTPSERRLINEQSREHRGSARATSARRSARQRRRPSETRSDHTSGQATSLPVDFNANITTTVSAQTTEPSNTTSTYPGQLILAPSSTSRNTTRSSTFESPASRPSSLPTSNPPSLPAQTSISTPTPLGHPTDPFNTTSVPLTPTTLHLLHYYKQTYYTTLWTTIHERLTPHIPDPTIIPHCTVDKVISDALRNRNRISCLLANTGSHMTLFGQSRSSTSPSLDPRVEVTNLSLLQRGTTSLRQEMVAKGLHPDNEMLMSAMHLYMAATRMGREEAAGAHLKGVRAMVEGILGHGEDVAGPNLGMLALVDGGLALELLSGREGVWMGADVGGGGVVQVG